MLMASHVCVSWWGVPEDGVAVDTVALPIRGDLASKLGEFLVWGLTGCVTQVAVPGRWIGE